MHKFLLILLIITLNACDSTYIPPDYIYRTYNFQTKHIAEVEKLLRDIAKAWELHIKEKDRESMKYLSSGEDAFFIFFLRDDEAIFTIGNVGAAHSIDIHAYNQGVITNKELGLLTHSIKDELEKRFDLDFCEIDLETSSCTTKKGNE